MWRRIIVAILMSSTVPADAAQPVTVDQLWQLLAGQEAAHLSDDQMALQLGTLQLTERLTDVTLDQIEAELRPGEKTATQLDVLADMSGFLEPPPREVPAMNPPDAAEQHALLQAAANFASVTLIHLPDFLATRTIRNFEDVPILTRDLSAQSGMHGVGSSMSEVAYLNGLEFASKVASVTNQASHGPQLPGLSSAGEFGPVLATIMSDSAASKITFYRWEQTATGPAAVFRFDVPEKSASYTINFCCAPNPVTGAMVSYRGKPAYRGSIAINPSTGSVIRLTLEADLASIDPIEHFGLVVCYGKVEIGGSSLICPLRSAVMFRAVIQSGKRSWDEIHLNEATYTNYRRFGSTAQIIDNAPTK